MNEFMESNRMLWDEWTRIHVAGDFYDVESFKDGRWANRLRTYEMEELGDVSGKDLLHVQCHFGLDTLSWARLGAKVTGVDYSEEAIVEARKLAHETDIEATFVQSNVYDMDKNLANKFDIVYTSRGVLGWLPDLKRWATILAALLRPGGVFYITEIHPVIQVFDDERSDGLHLRYPYWEGSEPLAIPVHGSYADASARVDTESEYGWPHSLGEIVTAIAQAGLRIESLIEFPFVEWPVEFLEEREDGTWRLPDTQDGELPLFFSLRAIQPLR